MAKILLEVCVDDAVGLSEAIAGGAGRIELCAALALGGLTPSYGLMQMAAQSGALCYPIIRPRSGDFNYTVAEVEVMRVDIRAARKMGLKGVVLGASHPDGRLNETVLRVLLAEARGLDTTLHRCIDLTVNKPEAVIVAKTLGFQRILTSGGAVTAAAGAETLAAMFAAAGDGLIIMPGSGISVETLPKLAHLPLTEIHASCASSLQSGGAPLAFGFQSGTEKRTDSAKVASLKAALALIYS
ncbi:copper homeostasis protein CutC [Cypionkella sp.]|uniref:copper homeostasis protein CutC n=1 Tax=Cypionkella sp. TaxID=2811411 RepID=UPI0026042111|nr:copper homeostasis protein CutC [Cypionkella sp.]MDB5666782.1 copper homeostasis protein CutC [Cypionkella sp.]